MAMTGRQFQIAAGDHEATIVEVGAGLRRYAVGGVDVTCTYPDDVIPPKACGITLVPWPNRIRDGKYSFDGRQHQLALTEPSTGNAIHGLGRWARWTTVRQEPDAVTLRLDIVPTNGYPFEVRAEVTYAVHAEAGLRVTTSARNSSPARVPFGAGAHPYLSTRGCAIDDVTLLVPAREWLAVDDQQIPVETRPVARTPNDLRRGRRLRQDRFDTGFTGLRTADGRGTAGVRTRNGGARLWFDDTYRFLQVFTVDALTDGQAGVAIEPMTCAPDAFNSGAGLIVLDRGGSWRGSWGVIPT